MPVTWLTHPDPAPDPDPLDGVAEPAAVAYSEKESYTEEGFSASVVLQCPWADRHKVADNISNYTKCWPYRSDIYIPITQVDVDPTPQVLTGQDGSGNTYLSARLSLSFATRPSEDFTSIPGAVVFTESIELNGEMLKLPPGPYYWDAGGTKPIKDEESPSKIMLGMDYVIQYTGLESIQVEAITLIDCINLGTVHSDSLNIDFLDGTLLYLPPSINRSVTRNRNNDKFDMQCRFSWRKAGWDKFWKGDIEAYTSMYKKVDNVVTPFDPFQKVSFEGVLP